MGSILSWRRRATVILAGITLVIGFTLMTFAVREAEREKLARERDKARAKQRCAELLTEETDALFSGVERGTTAALADREPGLNNLEDVCRRIAAEDDLIGDIFLAEGNGALVFPLKNPLSLAEERRVLAAQNLRKSEGMILFRSAASAELENRNLPFAIESYNTLLSSGLVDSCHALILNRLARCQLKAGHFKQALSTYSTILADHSHELSSHGIPLGIIAFSQIEDITLRTEPEEAGEIILGFYGRLADAEWPLDRAQFQFYRNLVQEMEETRRSNGIAVDDGGDFQNRCNWYQVHRTQYHGLRQRQRVFQPFSQCL